ncbi:MULTISPECIES: SDR family oxidoreductase [Salinibaculum]|uniref:SDR family oxidoreductase n=1 Tax=Salinibaculum TaxID=2732368 RepID=UPI0030D06C53
MLEGNVILVTGASQGMGRAMAQRLSEEGATLVLLSRDRQRLEEVSETLPGESHIATADVRDASAVSAAAESVIDEFGSVDAIINNAGVALTSIAGERKHVVDIEEDEWDTVVETNLKGVFLVTKHFLPSMLEQKRGNVINISSGFGRRAAPKWEPYLTTKWGLEGFTRSLALEVKPSGVNVNGLDPGGGVNTGFAEHLTESEREKRLPPDVMNDAIVRLVDQDPHGITGESMAAGEWQGVLSSMMTDGD